MLAVSVAMIVKNEAHRIADALRSVRSLHCVDELVVADTGSTDGTAEIARRLGARVIGLPWEGFAATRNRCAAECRNDWVLVIDGDEWLQSPTPLDAFVSTLPEETDGVAVRVQCVGPDGQLAERLLSVRAYRRSRGHWRFPVHNVLVGLESVAIVEAEIRAHYDADLTEQTRRRLKVLLACQQAEPLEPHYLFYLAKSYRILSEHAEVLAWGDRFFDAAGADSSGCPSVLAWMVEAHLALGDLTASRELLSLGLRRYPGWPDLHHLEVAFAVQRWVGSCVHAQGELITQLLPSRSVAQLQHADEVARLLRLPIRFPGLSGPAAGVTDGR